MKKKSTVFGVLQQVGGALMMPVAVLPAAGLMMGIGYTLTNATLLELCPFFGNGFWSMVALLFQTISGVVFGNLPLLFAVGAAAGLTENDGAAALAGGLGFLIMHGTIGMVLGITPEMVAEQSSMYTSLLGFNTLQMGPFGGIIIGYVASILYKRFHKVKLPDMLAFFSGKRCVPILMSFTAIILGVIFSFIWPPIQNGLNAMANGLVNANGEVSIVGLFVSSFLINVLLIFGLHHCVYPLFYYQLGTYVTAAGVTINGDNNIYFAELADGLVPTYGMGGYGSYILMMFIWPATLLAIYKCAEESKKKQAKSICLSAGVTAFFTGISEPAVFTFAFAAFPLFIVGELITSLTNCVAVALGARASTAFCGGLFDFTLDVIIPGGPKWILFIICGLAGGIAMYFISVFMIKKFDFKTPGREPDSINAEDAENLTVLPTDDKEKAVVIIEALGGPENINTVNCCFTRLRLGLGNVELLNEDKLKTTGAKGVIKQGGDVQVVYGPNVGNIRDAVQNELNKR